MSQVDRLLKMKEQIEKAELKKAELIGELKSKIKELKDKFKIDPDGARERITELKSKKEDLEEKISKKLEKLEENYEW